MYCWKCGIKLDLIGKVSFRASCDKCTADLHCCRNCKFYMPGKPNDCLVPGTEWVADREKANLCEDFAILGKPPGPKDDSTKKRFEDLFN